MNFLTLFWILATLSLTTAFTISERFAKQVLSRIKRANAGEETFRRSDLDRECMDEQCSAEEYLEYAENIDKNVRNKFNSHLFEVNYVECSVALSESSVLTNATVINALKYALGFHVRGACLHSFELESLNTGLEDVDVDWEDEEVVGGDDGADGSEEDDNDGQDDEV